MRPQAVVVDAQEHATGESAGTVLVATFRGSSVRLRVALGDGTELLVDVSSHRAADLAPGRRVILSLLDHPVLFAED